MSKKTSAKAQKEFDKAIRPARVLYNRAEEIYEEAEAVYYKAREVFEKAGVTYRKVDGPARRIYEAINK